MCMCPVVDSILLGGGGFTDIFMDCMDELVHEASHELHD